MNPKTLAQAEKAGAYADAPLQPGDSSVGADRRIRQKNLWASVGLLLFSAVLFFKGMADLPLWQDEGWSMVASDLPTWEAYQRLFEQDTHPPLYAFVLRGWNIIVGDQFFALRMLGFLCCLLSTALIYRIALDLFDLKAAIVAAIIFASHDYILVLGSVIRQYSFFVMLACLSSWLYLKMMKQRSAFSGQLSAKNIQYPSPANEFTGYDVESRLKPTPIDSTQSTSVDFPSPSAGIHSGASEKHFPLSTYYFSLITHYSLLITYTLTGVAMLYSLYWGAFILLAHGFHCLMFHPRRIKVMLVAAVMITLAYLPWLPYIYAQTAGSNSLMGGSSGFKDTLPISRQSIDLLLYQILDIPQALFGGLALTGIVGTFSAKKWRDFLPTSATMFAAFWFFVPILLPLLVTAFGFNILITRPMIVAIPGMALLIGHVLSQMERWQYPLLVAVILVNNLTTASMDSQWRAPLWEVADALKNYTSPQDAIVIEMTDWHAYALDYHVRLADVPFHQIIRSKHIRNGIFSETETDVNALINAHDSLWLVEFYIERDLRPDLAAMGFVQTSPLFEFSNNGDFSTTITRFARPPAHDPVVRFDAKISLAEINHFQDEQQLHVDLTWQPQTVLDRDYSVSVFLLAPNGTLAVQHDAYPLYGESPTLSWQPDNFYFDRHRLDISNLAPGDYQLGVRVYTWQDGISLPTDPCNVEDCSYFIVEMVTLP